MIPRLRFLSFWIWLAGALLFLPSGLIAQTIPYQKVELDALRDIGRVYAIHQDEAGYLWFGGELGLLKYSGYRSIGHAEVCNTSAFTVRGFHKDQNDRLWAFGAGGFVYRMKESRFELITPMSIHQYLPKAAKTLSNNMWVDTDGSAQLALTIASPPIAVTEDTVTWQQTDGSGIETFSVSEVDGILRYHKIKAQDNSDSIAIEYGGQRMVVSCQGQNSLTSFNYRALKTRSGSILLLSGNHLIRFDSSGVLDHVVFEQRLHNVLHEDKDGNIWTGGMGLWCFPEGKLEMSRALWYNRDMYIFTMLEDREGGFWLSTAYNGLLYAPNPRITLLKKDLFNDRNVTATAFHDGMLWVGTDKGAVFTVENAQVNQLDMPGHTDETLIYQLNFDRDGELWFATKKGIYRKQKDRYTPYQPGIGTITFLNNDSLFSGRYRGFKIFSDTGVNYSSLDDGFDVRVYNSYKGAGDTVWMNCPNSQAGTYFFEGDSIYPLITQRETDSNHVKIKRILDLAGTKPITIQNHTPYMIHLGKNTLDLDQCRAQNPINTLPICIRYQNGSLWITTRSGLSRIDLDATESSCINSRMYGASDGFMGNLFNYLETTEDRLVVKSSEGLYVAHYEDLSINQVPPNVRIHQLQISGKDTTLADEYELNYDQNFLTISFEGLSYKSAGNLDFKYKLEGIDREWVIRKTPNVQYTTLPPGDYTFSVYAANNDGIWSSEPATMRFSIAPPYWQTWWFRISVGALVLAMMWGGFSYRYRNLRTQLVLREQSLEAEQKALRAQMTPHFMFNALNSIQLLISDNERVFALKNVSKFARLMRKVLHSSDQSFVPLSEEIESLQLYLELESLRFEGRFTFNIDASKLASPENWTIPPMLIQPFVENSIWHGIMKKKPPHGSVNITFSMDGTTLRCTIVDDGVGRQRAREINDLRLGGSSSKGMSIIQQRVETINKQYKTNIEVKIEDLVSETNEPLGTKVELSFPG